MRVSVELELDWSWTGRRDRLW
jgi:hypothetical protein